MWHWIKIGYDLFFGYGYIVFAAVLFWAGWDNWKKTARRFWGSHREERPSAVPCQPSDTDRLDALQLYVHLSRPGFSNAFLFDAGEDVREGIDRWMSRPEWKREQ